MLPNSTQPFPNGDLAATHTVAGDEFQAFMQARADGHIIGSRPDYMAFFPAQTNAVNRELAEVFNTDANLAVRVRGIWIIPTQTAITGAQQAFDINKITSAGTTNKVAVTPRPMDSTFPALPSGVTAGYGSTAGAALGHLWFPVYLFNEETSAPVGLIAYQNQLPVLGDTIAEIVLRQNEGLQIKQTVGSVGLTGALIQIAVDN